MKDFPQEPQTVNQDRIESDARSPKESGGIQFLIDIRCLLVNRLFRPLLNTSNPPHFNARAVGPAA
jgi:hypothetical protein